MKPRDFLPPGTSELQIRIVECLHEDIGEHEDPPGSNRGRYPDMVNTEFGSPLGSPWCANALAHTYQRAGARLPKEPGSCDSWLKMAFERGLVSIEPGPGYAVIYGKKDPRKPLGFDATHIGGVEQVIAMPKPNPRTVIAIEGNTTLIPGFEREGWIMQQKAVDLTRLICYMKPQPAK